MKTKKIVREARFDLSVKTHGLEPILGAAYLMMDRAFVELEGDRAKKIEVVLRPKTPEVSAASVGEAFERELQTQKVRWAIARNNLPVREFIAEQAALLANGAAPPPPPAPAGEQLSDEQRREIDKLIAEVELEIKAMNDKKAVSDPKGIKASWEEKNGA